MRGKRNPIYAKYDGMTFAKDKKTGYYRSSKQINGRQVLLHRYVWEKHNGSIPKGMCVHHIDENKDNNDISNLALIERSRHSSMHTRERIESDPEKYAKDFVARTNDKAKEWHKSAEGKEWHREHAKKSILPGMEKKVALTCQYCGDAYETSASKVSTSKFCSNKCRAAARRHSGADDIKKVCPACGKTFTTHKYKGSETCSRECAWALRRKKA